MEFQIPTWWTFVFVRLLVLVCLSLFSFFFLFLLFLVLVFLVLVGPSDGAIYRLPFVIHVGTTNLWQSSYVSSTLEGLPPLIQRVGLGSWRRTWLQSCQSIDHGLLCFWFLCSHPWNSLAFFPLRPLPVHEQINHPHPFHPVDCHFSSCFFFHCCCFVLQSQHRPRYNILRPFSFAPWYQVSPQRSLFQFSAPCSNSLNWGRQKC